jgi:hypothetical protein
MNIVNRIIVLVLSLILFIFTATTALLLGGLLNPLVFGRLGVLLGLALFLAHLKGVDFTGAIVTTSVLAAVSFLFVILEILPLFRVRLGGRRQPETYVIQQDDLGQVTVDRKSVRDLIQYEAAAIPGVIKVRPPEVRDGPGGLSIYARTSLLPTAEATTIGKKLQEQIQSSVQQRMGLPVAQVRVATEIEPVNGTRQGTRQARVQ